MNKVNRSADPATIVEVEFDVDSREHAFVDASAEEGCTVELAEIITRPDGHYAQFFMVSGVQPQTLTDDIPGECAVEATTITDGPEGGLVEFIVDGTCPTAMLVRQGAIARSVRACDGRGTIIAEIPRKYDPGVVIERFLDGYPSAQLKSKREKDSVSPGITRTACEQILANHLTERQCEVLQTAFEAGYYDWPRECSGEEIAADLDISSATFSEHISAAERNLLSHLFEESRGDGALSDGL